MIAEQNLTLDVRGHKCPVPSLRLRKTIEFIQNGYEINLLTDDPMAQIDIPHFCQCNNIEVKSIIKIDNYWHFKLVY